LRFSVNCPVYPAYTAHFLEFKPLSRRRNAIPPVCKKLSLPSDLVAAVETKLFDVHRGKPTYGAFAELVTALLQNWLNDVEQPISATELLAAMEAKNV
jgi:hypothetical protein